MHFTRNIYVYYQRCLSKSINSHKVSTIAVKKSIVVLNIHSLLTSTMYPMQETDYLRQAEARGDPQSQAEELVVKSYQKASRPKFLIKGFFVWNLVHSRDDPLHQNLEFYLPLKWKGKKICTIFKKQNKNLEVESYHSQNLHSNHHTFYSCCFSLLICPPHYLYKSNMDLQTRFKHQLHYKNGLNYSRPG